MPSHRTSPSSGRRPDSAQEVEALRDELIKANTEYNKILDDRDRYKNYYEQIKKRNASTDSANPLPTAPPSPSSRDLKEKLQNVTADRDHYQEKSRQKEADYEALNKHWAKRYTDLDDKYTALDEKYTALRDSYNDLKAAMSASSAASSPLPDRAKESSSRKDDRGRTREKDREREKREQKAAKAEKERLSRRFDSNRDSTRETTTRESTRDRPPTTRRRDSHIENWGPGGRSASANPASRTYLTNTQTTTGGGRNVPRTPNPLGSSGGYSGSGSGSSAVYDDDYEDGNYHPYPIPR